MTSTSRLDPARPPAGRLRRAPRTPAEDFRTPVRGHAFAAPPPSAPPLAPGATAELVREPDNPRDRLAVAVWTGAERPWRVGYLDRTVAARLASRMDAGQRFRAEFAGWVEAPGAAWHRPLLRVATTAADRDDRSGPAGERSGGGLWGRPPASTRRILTPGR